MDTETLLSNLINAVIKNDTSKISKLLEDGADPNASEDKVHLTPLHYAAEYGSKEAALILIGAGANIHALNEEGETSEDVALRYGQKKMIALFKTLH